MTVVPLTVGLGGSLYVCSSRGIMRDTIWHHEVNAMVTNESAGPLMEAEVEAFADKLANWAAGLSPRERTILTEALARSAAKDGADVQGYEVPRDVNFATLPSPSKFEISPVLLAALLNPSNPRPGRH